MRTNAEPQDYEHALHGMDFPASRDQIVHTAQDKGGLDTEVIAMLERLPERTYESAQDLSAEVLRLYAATGGLGEGEPAAPSPISNANKELIGAMADPRGGEAAPLEPAARFAAERPTDDSEADAKRILERNRQLVDGEVEPSPAGEAEVGVGHMVNSDRSHTGGAAGSG